MAGKHGCTGTNKRGTPCNARTLKGRDVCLAHADKSERVATGFGVNGGRPKKPREVDLLRERLEANIEEWYTVLDEARTATRGVVVGSGESATIEYVPDHAIRLAAFREMFDRVHGKPKQSAEISGPEGSSLGSVFVMDPKLSEDARELLKRAAGTSGDEPCGPSDSY